MGVQNLPGNILLVDLPSKDLDIGNELKNLNELIHSKGACDVLIDFSKVEIVTSSNISNLLALRDLLREQEYQLIFYNVSVPTKGIFTVAGLDAVFEFAPDKNSALAIIEQTRKSDKPTHASS